MGLFDKFKKASDADWENAFKANPHFYSKPGVEPFCAYALTEDTETILPKAPRFAVEGKAINDYRLMLVSTTKDSVIGGLEYHAAIKKLEAYKLDSDKDRILVKGLTLDEMEKILK